MTKLFPKLFDNSKLVFILLTLISIGSIISALFLEFVLGKDPCILCIYERIPYLAMFIFGAIVLVTKKYSYLISKFIFLFILMISVGLASYHIGVEKEVFDGPMSCEAYKTRANTAEELAKALLAKPAVSCKRPNFFLFNLSLAHWNFILSFFMLSILLVHLRRTK